MKEGLPESNNDKMNRREFLKTLGIGAVAVGAITTGAYKFEKFLEKDSTKRKEHAKQGVAIVVSKEVLNSKGLPSEIDKGNIPYRGVDTCYINVKINEKETAVIVSLSVYKKYNIGD